MLQELKLLKDEMPIEEPKEEIDTIIKFINKNIQIISQNITFKEKSPINISTQVYSGKKNIEIERLNSLKYNDEELLKEIAKSYKNGKISAKDITYLDLVKNKEMNNHETHHHRRSRFYRK